MWCCRRPQAGALRAALGLAAADVPVTAALLEVATVGLLRELAEAGVVVAVDDEQWLDPDSLRLLESAVARLKDVPVGWLATVRSGHTGRGLAPMLDHELGAAAAQVDLAGLDDAALLQLVMDRFPGRWSPGVLRRVVVLGRGQPVCGAGTGPRNSRPGRPRGDSRASARDAGRFAAQPPRKAQP